MLSSDCPDIVIDWAFIIYFWLHLVDRCFLFDAFEDILVPERVKVVEKVQFAAGMGCFLAVVARLCRLQLDVLDFAVHQLRFSSYWSQTLLQFTISHRFLNNIHSTCSSFDALFSILNLRPNWRNLFTQIHQFEVSTVFWFCIQRFVALTIWHESWVCLESRRLLLATSGHIGLVLILINDLIVFIQPNWRGASLDSLVVEAFLSSSFFAMAIRFFLLFFFNFSSLWFCLIDIYVLIYEFSQTIILIPWTKFAFFFSLLFDGIIAGS